VIPGIFDVVRSQPDHPRRNLPETHLVAWPVFRSGARSLSAMGSAGALLLQVSPQRGDGPSRRPARASLRPLLLRSGR
jgi:hypothetical protein